jgi:hypothetical protein
MYIYIYITGGDLGFHLTRKGRFSEKEAKYYAARTLLGLASMHEKNIAYRYGYIYLYVFIYISYIIFLLYFIFIFWDVKG